MNIHLDVPAGQGFSPSSIKGARPYRDGETYVSLSLAAVARREQQLQRLKWITSARTRVWPATQALCISPKTPGIVEPRMRAYGVMVSTLSTLVTPGADSAAFFAAAASLQELTCPCIVTWPSSVVSQIRRASI